MDDIIECQECGEKFAPITDAYRCPLCGTKNHPDDEGDPDA